MARPYRGRIRCHLHPVSPAYQRQFAFQYRKSHFHAPRPDYPAERFRSIRPVKAPSRKVGHHSVERGRQYRLFQLIPSQFVIRTALSVAAFHLRQLHDVRRNLLHTVRSISLAYQHVLHFQLRLFQGVLCLFQLVSEGKKIQFGQLLPPLHPVAVLHVDVCHRLRCYPETQVGLLPCLHLSVADQFMTESCLLQRHDSHLVLLRRQYRFHSLLVNPFVLVTTAGSQQPCGKQRQRVSVDLFSHSICCLMNIRFSNRCLCPSFPLMCRSFLIFGPPADEEHTNLRNTRNKYNKAVLFSQLWIISRSSSPGQ